MQDYLIRFVVGGAIVSVFALFGDLFKPKSFAGLFGAAPSVGMATLSLTLWTKGAHYAAAETSSMVLGAVAMGIYSFAVCQLLKRSKLHALSAATGALFLWCCVAFAMKWIEFG